MNVKGATALVTGSANGIGFWCARKLLEHGIQGLAIVDLPEGRGEKVVADFQKEFSRCRIRFFPCDVSKLTEFTACIKSVMSYFNGLDILVNNAGIFNDAKYELCIAINFTAVVHSTLLGIELMGTHKGGKGGTIVNISSLSGLVPTEISPVYTATKHGVVGLGRALKPATKRVGVRLVTLCPGYTQTALLTEDLSKFLDIINEELLNAESPNVKPQAPENVGKAVVEIIEKGETGGVYIQNDGGPPFLLYLLSEQR